MIGWMLDLTVEHIDHKYANQDLALLILLTTFYTTCRSHHVVLRVCKCSDDTPLRGRTQRKANYHHTVWRFCHRQHFQRGSSLSNRTKPAFFTNFSCHFNSFWHSAAFSSSLRNNNTRKIQTVTEQTAFIMRCHHDDSTAELFSMCNSVPASEGTSSMVVCRKIFSRTSTHIS